MLQLSFVNFPAGSYLLVEGRADNDRFYIIQKGQVSTSKTISTSKNAVLGPGDFVGVIPCMSGHNQIESVYARTPVTAIAVRKDQYPDLIQQNTPVALKIIRTFANKLRTMNATLGQLTMNTLVDESAEHLYDVGKYYEENGFNNLAMYAYSQYLRYCPCGAQVQKTTQRIHFLAPRSKAVYLNATDAAGVRAYPKDTMIFSEFQPGSDMYIIQSGQVKITKIVNGNEVILTVLKKGDFFGEMALLENRPRSASAIAFEDCRVMVVNRANFEQMVHTQPQMISRLTTTLANRLWNTTRQLENTQISDPVHRLFDMLELQLEKEGLHKVRQPYHFDFTPYDLVRMCGIPQDQQNAVLSRFMNAPTIRIFGGKVETTDTMEIVKNAELYRRQAVRNH